MLTDNEKNVLRILLTSFEDLSINRIARIAMLSPNGAFKILKKFENEGILKSKLIANIKSYRLDFDNDKTGNILQLALIPVIDGRTKFRYDDLKELKKITLAGIMFGSYIDLKKEPNDLDLLFIIDTKHYKIYKENSMKIFKTIPIKVQDVLQTKKDFKENIIKKDKVIVDILKTGKILWGYDKIIELIKEVNKK
jgi:DNA-binding Lrp family transcriptional regulator